MTECDINVLCINSMSIYMFVQGGGGGGGYAMHDRMSSKISKSINNIVCGKKIVYLVVILVINNKYKWQKGCGK